MLALAFMGGAWIFLQQYNIEGLDTVRVVPRDGKGFNDVGTTLGGQGTVAQPRGDTIKIASFNIQVFGVDKLTKPKSMEVLSRIVRQFDVVAVQEIRAVDQSVIPQFIQLINATGRDYDYVIGPRLGRSVSKEQYAYIFDRETVEVDRYQLYTLDDPSDLLHREPLVAWFRARGPETDQAFTFSLVNFHTDPDEAAQELTTLPLVLNAVRNDGRNEDDVILLGDFNASDVNIQRFGGLSGVTMAIEKTPTNTRGTEQYDNIIFQGQATPEYVGRAGVFDFLRQYNLTIEEALQVSDHLPVWAEFSIYEGGQGGRVADGVPTSAVYR